MKINSLKLENKKNQNYLISTLYPVVSFHSISHTEFPQICGRKFDVLFTNRQRNVNFIIHNSQGSLVPFTFLSFAFQGSHTLRVRAHTAKELPYISYVTVWINLEKHSIYIYVCHTIDDFDTNTQSTGSIVYPIERARTVSFLRKERKRTTSNSHSMTSGRGSMPEQRMTSDWQIVNRCQLNSPRRPDTHKLAPPWIRRRKFDRTNFIVSSVPRRIYSISDELICVQRFD